MDILFEGMNELLTSAHIRLTGWKNRPGKSTIDSCYYYYVDRRKTVNNKRRKVGIRARIPVLYKELSCFSLVDIFDLRYYLMLVPGVDGWGTGEEEIFNNNHQDMMPRFCLVRRRIINLRNIWMVNRISSIRDSARINCLLLIFL